MPLFKQVIFLALSLLISACSNTNSVTATPSLPDYHIASTLQNQPRETLFFDPFVRYWRDEIDQCHTCMPANGFSEDGVVTTDQQQIKWHGFKLRLQNDLEQLPDIDEVAGLIQQGYVFFSEHYPVHIRQENGVFYIIIPAPVQFGSIDITNPRGNLAADYYIQSVAY